MSAHNIISCYTHINNVTFTTIFCKTPEYETTKEDFVDSGKAFELLMIVIILFVHDKTHMCIQWAQLSHLDSTDMAHTYVWNRTKEAISAVL